MFNIELLPALHGDCIWIEYGNADRPYRILIDGGPLPTYKKLCKRMDKVPEDQRCLELFVLTHVDADHIESAVKLLNTRELDFKICDLWFNAWKHLSSAHLDELGPLQGEYVSSLIDKHGLPWNKAFSKGPVAISQDEELPEKTLEGGMKLTLLSPDSSRLEKLAPDWAKTVRSEGFEPGYPKEALEHLSRKKRYRPPDELGRGGLDIRELAQAPFESDRTTPNGSSIAFLAEHGDKSCLFLGDAHAPMVVDSIKRLLTMREEEKLVVDAVKLPHHGSENNVSRELIEIIESPRYLVSTNGNTYKHPDVEAIARVIEYGGRSPAIFFNYLSKTTKIWQEESERSQTGFDIRFPELDSEGILVEL